MNLMIILVYVPSLQDFRGEELGGHTDERTFPNSSDCPGPPSNHRLYNPVD